MKIKPVANISGPLCAACRSMGCGLYGVV